MSEEKNIADRFKGAPWYPVNVNPPIVIGAGGIGSWLGFFLARLQIPFIIFDDDIVEVNNRGGQMYSISQEGTEKVHAVIETYKNYCYNNSFDELVGSVAEKYTEDTEVSPIMFLATDNIESRKVAFTNWKNYLIEHQDNPIYLAKSIFIDGRLLAEQYQIYCVQYNNIEKYEESLFTDELPEVDCTLKQTSHIAAMIAAQMTAYFTNYYTNYKKGEVIRRVPFYTEYHSPFNRFKTEYL